MKFALCAFPLLAAALCSAQQSGLVPSSRAFVVTEAKTISIGELQQRNQSKARNTFSDAKVAAQKGDHLRAIKLFDKVLKTDPSFSDARNDLAVELVVAGQTDRAVAELKQLLQLDPHFLMAYTNLGVILCNQKNFSEAEAVVRRALTIEPQSAKSSLLLAIALDGQGKRDAEVQSALVTAARSNPLASKLLKAWFGNSDLASVITPN